MVVYVHSYFSAEYHFIWKCQLSKLEHSARMCWVCFGFHWTGSLYLELSKLSESRKQPRTHNCVTYRCSHLTYRKMGFQVLDLKEVICWNSPTSYDYIREGDSTLLQPEYRCQRDRLKPLLSLRPGVRTIHPTLPLSTSAARLLYGRRRGSRWYKELWLAPSHATFCIV